MSNRRVHSNTAWWIVGTVCAVLLLLGLRHGVTAYRKAEVIAVIERNGGWVSRKRSGPEWLRKLCGDPFMERTFDYVTHIGTGFQKIDRDTTRHILENLFLFPDLYQLDLQCRELLDEDLLNLNRLHKLEDLNLTNTNISSRGISYLNAANRIWALNLADTPVDDDGLRLLAKWPCLSNLYLDGTPVTDAGIAHLKTSRTLLHLSLSNTSVSDTGVAELVAALPQVQVTDD